MKDTAAGTTSPSEASVGESKETLASDAPPVLEFVVGAAACAYVVVYFAVAIQRIRYPFDLEWMEGAIVDHVRRILAGQKIYVAPSLGFVPFLYPPLYYYVSAAVSLVTGIGWFPLRLVSLSSSGVCFGLIYRLVSRETGSRYAGVLALGTYAATYRIGGAWFDLARVDSMFLALSLAALYVSRFADSSRSWALAGVLLALSALTKQTALMIVPPLLLYALAVNWRAALVFGGSFAGLTAAATLALDRWHHGWYRYYVIGLPVRIQDVASESANFWTKDILGAMPIASALAVGFLVARRRRNRSTLFYVALAIAFLGSSWISRVHSGAYDNVLIPAYASLAILLALAAHELPDHASVSRRPGVRAFIAAACLLQLATLAYDPRTQLPTNHDVELERELTRSIRDTDGEVYMASHGYFPMLAGKAPHAHSWAILDILRAGGNGDTQRRLRDEIRNALEQRRFRLIVLDRQDYWLQPEVDNWYRQVGPALASEGLWTLTGYHTHPQWLYVPR